MPKIPSEPSPIERGGFPEADSPRHSKDFRDPLVPQTPPLEKPISAQELRTSLDTLMRNTEGRSLTKTNFKGKIKLKYTLFKNIWKGMGDIERIADNELQMKEILETLQKEIKKEWNAPEGMGDDFRLKELADIYFDYLIAEGIDIKHEPGTKKELPKDVFTLIFVEKVSQFLEKPVQETMRELSQRQFPDTKY